ncbi:hypothetical protein PsorP6_016154 [Peronosclerospora sorghi]|uniref:Uncharacterized protein n=1 Tax=Peronosclerospora sorghi TaxID=230839 RepID=A0ACC0VM92_9STRA|nr:hypothetical protein PsorP6_016154 [Peronosclerospora sorghi]
MEITGRYRKPSKSFRSCYGSAWRLVILNFLYVQECPSVSRVAGAMYNIFDDKWKAPGVQAFIACYLDTRFKPVVQQMDTYLVGTAKKLIAEMIEEEQYRQREKKGDTN